MSESEVIEAIDAELARLSGRAFLRPFTARETWEEAVKVLSLRHLVETDGARWRWVVEEEILRRYYANGLLSFDDVAKGGWEWS